MSRSRLAATAGWLVLVAACAGTPPRPEAALVEVPAVRVKLVLLAIKAPDVLAATAETLEAAICAELSMDVRYEVVCPADARAAADYLRSRAAIGACDENNDCVDQVAAMSTGDEVIQAELASDPGGLVLSLHRLGKDGNPLKSAQRKLPALVAFQQELPALAAEALAR